MVSTFTENEPVDYAALAENCFAGAQQGLSGAEIAARNAEIAGLESNQRTR